ncbi:unnamed protein product [Laminaria digitata]
MAHRHRHPEDQNFFQRLEQLFHVLEDEGGAQKLTPAHAGTPLPPTPAGGTAKHAVVGNLKTPSGVPHCGVGKQPTRDGNPRPPTPAGGTTEHAIVGNPKTPSGVPRGGGGEQPTRGGNPRPPTPTGTGATKHALIGNPKTPLGVPRGGGGEQPTRDYGNPHPPTPAGTTVEHALVGNPKTPSGVPRGGGGGGEQPTRDDGNPRPPTPAGTTKQARGGSTAAAACLSGIVIGVGGALRDSVEEETERGTASNSGDGDAARENVTSSSRRSDGAVDVAVSAGPSSCEEAGSLGVGKHVATAAAAAAAADADFEAAADPAAADAADPAAAAAVDPPPAAAAAAVRVGGKAITANPEQERGASSGRGGKCDGADVRIFCIWSRAGGKSCE